MPHFEHAAALYIATRTLHAAGDHLTEGDAAFFLTTHLTTVNAGHADCQCRTESNAHIYLTKSIHVFGKTFRKSYFAAADENDDELSYRSSHQQ